MKKSIILVVALLFIWSGVSHGEPPAPTKRVLFEMFTGAWCGYCPDGHVYLDNIIAQHGDLIVPVCIHYGDAMQFSDGIRPVFTPPGYPTGMIDRVLFSGQSEEAHSRGAWANNVQSQLNTSTPVHVGLLNTYNATTREIEVTVQAQFSEAVSGDHRFLCYVVENRARGAGTGWNQSNYYNNTPGHPYYQAGNPIIGYIHHFVLRAVLSGPVGNPGVIPANVTAGQIISESFSYVLPDGFNENEITLVGAVAHYGSKLGAKYVLNAAQIPMSQTVPALNMTGLFILLVFMSGVFMAVRRRNGLATR